MQLAEIKAAKELGDAADGVLRTDLAAAAATFNGKMAATQRELESLWTRWDDAVDSGDVTDQSTTRDALVALLNKHSYLRNLLRDVNAALE